MFRGYGWGAAILLVAGFVLFVYPRISSAGRWTGCAMMGVAALLFVFGLARVARHLQENRAATDLRMAEELARRKDGAEGDGHPESGANK